MNLTSKGYVRRTFNGRMMFEHVAVVERVLMRRLPARARVHHINGVKHDNRNANLVACEDQAYHLLLHIREKALDACGNPSFRQCRYCLRWDDPSSMTLRGSNYSHLPCAAKWQAEYRVAHPRPKKPRATAEHCKNGHPWTSDTAHINPSGSLICRQCDRDRKPKRRF